MEKDRLFLKVLIISSAIFLFPISGYFFTPPIHPSLIISVIYLPLGIIAAFISSGLFRQLRTKKEISMVNFLFEIKKFNEEIKVIYFSSLIFFVCWLYWGLSLWLFFEADIPEIIKTILWYTGDIWIFSSLIFAISFIFVTYRWVRRFMKYD